MLNQDLHIHTESHLCALIVNFLSHWGRLVFAKKKRKEKRSVIIIIITLYNVC